LTPGRETDNLVSAGQQLDGPSNRPKINIFFRLGSAQSTSTPISEQKGSMSSMRDVSHLAEEYGTSRIQLVKKAPLISSSSQMVR
jgi:hypothetical protein